MLLYLVTPCFVVAVQPCMEWIPIKKRNICCLIYWGIVFDVFLIKWWSWIAGLIEFPKSINIYSIQGFGKEWISWIHLNVSLFARPYSFWSCSHCFTALSVLKSCPTKLIFCSGKEEKKTSLLPVWIWQLNHKNLNKIADGTNAWHENLLSQVLIISL